MVCISPHAELDLRALLGGEMKGREGQEKKGEWMKTKIRTAKGKERERR